MTFGQSAEEGQEDLTLVVVCVDRTTPVASRADVVQPTGNFDSRSTTH